MGQRGQRSCGSTSHSESGGEAARKPRSLNLAPPQSETLPCRFGGGACVQE